MLSGNWVRVVQESNMCRRYSLNQNEREEGFLYGTGRLVLGGEKDKNKFA